MILLTAPDCMYYANACTMTSSIPALHVMYITPPPVISSHSITVLTKKIISMCKLCKNHTRVAFLHAMYNSVTLLFPVREVIMYTRPYRKGTYTLPNTVLICVVLLRV